MNSQRLHVKIDLKLQGVTCPGVWLCRDDYLEVTIKALGYFFRTGAIEPCFPLLCHDHYKIEGYFKNAESIASLINNLSNEPLEITLWQCGRRLSYYQGLVMDLIQYIEPKLQCFHINTTRLLMKTTPAFPGIIAPKVELMTKFFIKDKILNMYNSNKDVYSCSNISKNIHDSSKSYSDIKEKLYKNPYKSIHSDTVGKSIYSRVIHNQRTLVHDRNGQNKLCNNSPSKLLIDYVYSNSSERRFSIASRCSSNTTQTLVQTANIKRNGNQNYCEFNSTDRCCELCRIFKEVFQE